MKKNFTLSAIIILFIFSAMNCKKDDNKDNTSDSSAISNTNTTVKEKYGIKSAIVTYNEHMDMGGGLISDTKTIYYFDNYGVNESKEEFNGDNLKSRTYSKDGYIYDVSFGDKSVTKTQDKYGSGIEDKFEILETYKTDSRWKILADTTIAGKTCQYYSFSTTTKIGGNDVVVTSKTAGYKGIKFYELSMVDDLPVVNSVQKYEEGASIPASAFTYPSEFTVAELKY
jgi:hypothetical protein